MKISILEICLNLPSMTCTVTTQLNNIHSIFSWNLCLPRHRTLGFHLAHFRRRCVKDWLIKCRCFRAFWNIH